MNGLQEIIAINNHNRAVLGDQERRALGLKPATATGKALRSVAASRPIARRAGPRVVTVQGRNIAV